MRTWLPESVRRRKIDQLKERLCREVYDQFVDICNKLEDHYRDMQDMEFTIEDKASVYAADTERKENCPGSAENRL